MIVGLYLLRTDMFLEARLRIGFYLQGKRCKAKILSKTVQALDRRLTPAHPFL